MGKKIVIICFASIIIIIAITLLIVNSSDINKENKKGYDFFENDESEIKAEYYINEDSKNTTLIDPSFVGYISKLTIDYKNVKPCNTFIFNKGHHYVTFTLKSLESTFNMFALSVDLIEINLENFDSSNVKDMGWMFYGCSSLQTVIIKN